MAHGPGTLAVQALTINTSVGTARALRCLEQTHCGGSMVDVSRRSFMVGAGLATAASIASFPRQVQAKLDKPGVEASPDLQPLIDRERTNILAVMAKEDLPGAGICLIYQGKPVWIEGFGVTDRRSNREVTDSTIFNLESTSKNFTATAIMLAVQRGLLDLDEPITTYLPDFTVHSRFDIAPEAKITLRLLLSHRAGARMRRPSGTTTMRISRTSRHTCAAFPKPGCASRWVNGTVTPIWASIWPDTYCRP